MAKFNWRVLERKWQKKWAWAKVDQTDPDPRRPKYFVTAAYPYPNSPQHIGHARTYTIADANARFHRMRGYNTLYPMGFHYTGTPLYAMAKRLRENDPEIVKTFTEIYRIPRTKLEGLKEPKWMAEYFRNDIKKGMIEIGYSIDWRREFTTIDHLYNRFIQWHFRWLNQHGLITKGTHPVAWCPNDENPVGTVDTQGDVEPEIGESSLIKFRQDEIVYPTATLRPETVFGVTNLWVNPEAQYVQARVDEERWIVSLEAVATLSHQNHRTSVEREFSGKELLWKTVTNPVTQEIIPILPARFVEADNGTGIVMSVPGHAPYDYQALVELKTSPSLPDDAKEMVGKVESISVITLGGFSQSPAADIVKKYAITDQKDPRLAEATKNLYSKEFHGGMMSENARPYVGKPVEQARQEIIQELTNDGRLSKLYEILNKPITCRCGTRVVVHIVDNQWFINYGDPDWKKQAHLCLEQMTILPEERRNEFNYALDWLKERACARKVGLGTRLPWDLEWIIEALSDSVIYMAYYILAKYLANYWVSFKKFERTPDNLPDSFFNYIYLGEGTADEITRETGISKRIVEAIRNEFTYFYPVDMRHSAKDLVSNHLSMYIFHHTALFPKNLWPKGIVANGFVLMERAKMSKSLENIIPLRQAIAKFGADPLRVGVLSTAELNQDTDFSESLVATIQERLVNLVVQSRKLGRRRVSGQSKPSTLDKWMLSRLNSAAQVATTAMEKLRVREVINTVLYQIENDAAWYQRRLGPRKKQDGRDAVLKQVYDFKARMIAPLAPHVAEEMWASLGNKGMVAKADWPEFDASLHDRTAEAAESIIRQTLDDTAEILRATGLTPKRITYYSATPWKSRIYQKALGIAVLSQTDQGSFIREVMSDAELRSIGKPAADFASKAIKQATQMKEDLRNSRVGLELKETKILEDAKEFFSREFKAEIQVGQEGETRVSDPKDRARTAEPYRPAIFIE